MRHTVILAIVCLIALPAVTLAQGNPPDTLDILESTTIMYDGQMVDYFLMDVGDSAEALQFMFIQDSAFVRLIGFVGDGDTSMLPDAITWMKTVNPMVGDSWEGMLVDDGITSTNEQIAGTKVVSVPAGNLFVYEISVYDLAGSYLGEKWYADGIGLVGWDIGQCNESQSLELLSYDLAPSSDFWPHSVGDQWVIQSYDTTSTVTADSATITIDGNPGDWAGITPVVSDPSGDDSTGFNGNDIRDLYVAVDATHLYLMADFHDGSPDPVWGAADPLAYVFVFDEDVSNFWGLAVSFSPGLPGNWTFSVININGSGTVVAVNSVVEVSIPLSSIGSFSYELPAYYLAVGGGAYDVSCYNWVRLQPPFCPVAVTGDVQSSGDVNSTDIIYLVNYVLKGGPDPMPCPAAGDANCTGDVNSTDIIYLVNYVLKGGPGPCDVCGLIPDTWSCP